MQFQTSLLPEMVEEQRIDEQADWVNDDWESPDPLAEFIGSLIHPYDRLILDAGAGKGAISKHLPDSIWSEDEQHQNRDTACIELSQERYNIGSTRYPEKTWFYGDFLDSTILQVPELNKRHVITSNPPFSLLLEFINQGINLLDPSYPIARLLYVAPCDALQSKERNQIFKSIDCHVHHTYAIVGRVAYIKNGKAMSGRQINDVILDIRLGKSPSSITFFEV